MTYLRRYAPYLLVIVSLLAAGLNLVDTYRAFDLSDDMVSPWEEHMKLIREALPPDVYLVSYVDGSYLPDRPAGHDSAEFFMTQYGVAPVAIETGLNHEWMIGNFGNTIAIEDITAWLDQQLGSYTILDIGFGIYLIHKTGD